MRGAAQVLRRSRGLRTERRRRMPGPARVPQQRAGQRHGVGLAVGQHRLGLRGFRDQAHRDHLHRNLALDRLGEMQLVAGADRDLLRRMQAAAGHVDEMAAARVQGARQHEALRQVPAALHPVAGGDADADRHAGGHRGLDRVEHRQHQPHAVLQRTAVIVVALVAERRQELVQQVAMRRMHLDQVQAQARRAAGGLGEGGDDAIDAGLVERARQRAGGVVGNRRRRDHLPAARIAVRDRATAGFPRLERRRLAPRVRQLHADRHRRPAAHRGQRPRERGFGGVVVQAEVGPADPAGGLNRGGLGDQQAGAGLRQRAPVLDMPVVGLTVDRRVLAHRRDHDAVRQLQRAQRQRGEQVAHADPPGKAGIIGAGGTRDQRHRRNAVARRVQRGGSASSASSTCSASSGCAAATGCRLSAWNQRRSVPSGARKCGTRPVPRRWLIST